MRTLVIPDLHCPFHLPDAFAFVNDVAKTLKPDRVVCLGDEIDAHAFSRYAKHPDAPGAADELRQARECLAAWYRRFPVVDVCFSNHTWRPFARSTDAGLPRSIVKDIRDILGAPAGWRWRASWVLDGVQFQHGDGYGGKNAAIDAALDNRCGTVLGHLHSLAGVTYRRTAGGVVWGMNAGCLVDVESCVFDYARFHRNKPILGCGVVVDGAPQFIPYGEAR